MRKSASILIAEDEKNMRQGLQELFEDDGYVVETASDGNKAAKKIQQRSYDLVVTDIKMPGMDGMKVLKKIKDSSPHTPVIMITGYGTIENSVEAMKLGAYDYITKPFNLEEVKLVVEKALQFRKLNCEVTYLRRKMGTSFRLDQIVGKSDQLQRVLELTRKVAPTDTTVLITGESGTGKELIAKAIHSLSLRSEAPFVPVSCAGLKESLLESELFGHAKGAFTGAIADKRGLFEIASGGTFFFDEIAETSAPIQAKLLRVLQEREFMRLGDTKVITTDIRLVAATNKDLKECIEKGTFREDLYYRLNVVSILLPPLRKRKGDIPLLANHFLKRYNEKMRREVADISPEAMTVLIGYDWPGNVRELENVIERAVVLETDNTVTLASLPERLLSERIGSTSAISGVPYKEAKRQTLDTFNREFVTHLLEIHGGNVSQAAEATGMDRPSLHRLMRKYGINTKDFG